MLDCAFLCVHQCFQCELSEQFVQLVGYLLVTVCVGEGPWSRVSTPSPWCSLGEDVFASWSHCSSEKVFLREEVVERSLC